MMAALQPAAARAVPRPRRPSAATCRRQLVGQSLAPLSLPLVFSGFDARDLRVGARRLLRPWASRPVMGTGKGALP